MATTVSFQSNNSAYCNIYAEWKVTGQSVEWYAKNGASFNRGHKEWDNEKGYLVDACFTAQDEYKRCLDYFRVR